MSESEPEMNSDDEFGVDPIISGKWTYSVTSKMEEPKFSEPVMFDTLLGSGRPRNTGYP